MNTSDDEASAGRTDLNVTHLDGTAAESHASDGSNDQLLQLNACAIEKVTKSRILAVSDLDKRARKYTSSEEIKEALCVISITEDNHVSDAESEYTADSENAKYPEHFIEIKSDPSWEFKPRIFMQTRLHSAKLPQKQINEKATEFLDCKGNDLENSRLQYHDVKVSDDDFANFESFDYCDKYLQVSQVMTYIRNHIWHKPYVPAIFNKIPPLGLFGKRLEAIAGIVKFEEDITKKLDQSDKLNSALNLQNVFQGHVRTAKLYCSGFSTIDVYSSSCDDVIRSIYVVNDPLIRFAVIHYTPNVYKLSFIEMDIEVEMHQAPYFFQYRKDDDERMYLAPPLFVHQYNNYVVAIAASAFCNRVSVLESHPQFVSDDSLCNMEHMLREDVACGNYYPVMESVIDKHEIVDFHQIVQKHCSLPLRRSVFFFTECDLYEEIILSTVIIQYMTTGYMQKKHYPAMYQLVELGLP